MKLYIISVQWSQDSNLLRTLLVDSIAYLFNEMINKVVEFLVSDLFAVLILNFHDQCLKIFKIEVFISFGKDELELISVVLDIVDHLAIELEDACHAFTSAPLFHETDKDNGSNGLGMVNCFDNSQHVCDVNLVALSIFSPWRIN